MADYVVVVGAVNLDISGISTTKLIYGDSNPGHVSVTLGGVGRNIAENLLRLGFDVKLITALGDDGNSDRVIAGCRETGLDISKSLTVKGARASTYLCVSDCDGDIAAAVNDMAIYDNLTPAFIESRMDTINGARLVIIDANIPESCVRFLAQNCRPPVVADPVSVKKAGKLLSSIGKFAFIKPNRAEAALLSGVEIHSDDDLSACADAFFEKGLKRVIISLGNRGAYYNDGKQSGIVPCFPSKIVNTTGCGDAFLAGAAAGMMLGRDTRGMVKMGLACAGVCAMTDMAVNHSLCMSTIKTIVSEP